MALSRRIACATGTRGSANWRVVSGTGLRPTPSTVQSISDNSMNILMSYTGHRLSHTTMLGKVCTKHQFALHCAQTDQFQKRMKCSLRWGVTQKQSTLIAPHAITSKLTAAEVTRRALTVRWSNYMCNQHHHPELQKPRCSILQWLHNVFPVPLIGTRIRK